jgi:hypothetical protein
MPTTDRNVLEDTGAPFLMISSMDVAPDKEGLFNEVYDKEHLCNLAAVPGVLRIDRYVTTELVMAIGGRVHRVGVSGPKYHAIYALTTPDVLVSEAWNQAVEAGRWPGEVRPFTLNREHLLCKRLGG